MAGLANQRASTLVDHTDVLREASRMVLRSRPVTIDAMVTVPDHIHAVWTLPEGEADYSTRYIQTVANIIRRLRNHENAVPILGGRVGWIVNLWAAAEKTSRARNTAPFVGWGSTPPQAQNNPS